MMQSRLTALAVLFGLSTAPLAAQPAWVSRDDSAAQTRLVAVQPIDNETSVTVPLELPGPGYVSLVLPDDRPGVQAVLVDGLGGRHVGTSARIALPEAALAELVFNDSIEPLALSLRYWPELDLTEPNDDPLLAWPVVVRQTESALLFPIGDVDHFAFSLEADTRLSVQFHTPGFMPEISILAPETGEVIAGGAELELLAGDYVLRLTAPPGVDPQTPEAVSFTLVPRPDLPLVDAAGERRRIQAGQPQLVPAGLNAAGFTLRVDQPGLYTYTTTDLGPDVSFTLTNSDGERLGGTAAHLAPGEYQFDLANLNLGSEPGFVTVYRRSMTDPVEPNDFAADAHPVEIDSPFEVMLEPYSADNWYVMTPEFDGQASFLVEIPQGGCDSLWLWQINPEDALSRVGIPASALTRTRTFGPVAVSEGVAFRFNVACAEAVGGPPVRVTAHVEPEGEGATTVEADSSVYLIGLELGDTQDAALATYSRAAGVNYVEAEDAEVLDNRIRDISRAELGDRSSGWLWWLVLILLGAGGFYFLRHRLQVLGKSVYETDPRA